MNMDIEKLENICSSICFRFINHELVYPKKINQISYMILYPTDGFYLTKKQYLSITDILKERGNSNYFISDIEFSDSFSENDDELGHEHRRYKLFNYADYINEKLLFEYAIYDVNGLWGISVFQDYFAIVCGDEKFIESVKQHYSNSNDIQKFREFVQSSEITNETFKNEMIKLGSKSK